MKELFIYFLMVKRYDAKSKEAFSIQRVSAFRMNL